MGSVFASGATHILVLRTIPRDIKRSFWEKSWLKTSNWFFCTPSYLDQEQELDLLKQTGRVLEVVPEKIIATNEKNPDLIRKATEEGRLSFQRFWKKILEKRL